MENKKFHIALKCLFCGCNLKKGDTEKTYHSGDLLKCQECGELNDYDSLLKVAVDEGKSAIVSHVRNEIKAMLKGIFKK